MITPASATPAAAPVMTLPEAGSVPMPAGSGLRVAVATLGCKLNRYDSAVIEDRLRGRGWSVVDFDDEADAYVVNSCTVTDRADRDARRLVRRARRRSPGARVVVTGCWAQASPGEVEAMEGVDYVVGLGRLGHLLAAVAGELDRRLSVGNLRRADRVETVGVESFPGRTRAFVKVQEGCDLFCTFCIVPVARGRSRSVPARDVLDEIERLAARGYREVVLTGVHLGGYGADLEPARDLAWLLECIAERQPGLRVRVSSVDPPELTPRLLDVLADGGCFCPHLHVPVQSLDDGVLARMRRRYGAGEAVAALEGARARLGDDVALGVDVITGFPEESEAEYLATRERLAGLGLAYLHVFPYSIRSSTSAARRWAALPDAEVHARSADLRRLDAEVRRKFRRRFVGRDVDVVLEGRRDEDTGLWPGTSAHYVPVSCRVPLDEPHPGGSLRRVRIDAEGSAALLGRLVS